MKKISCHVKVSSFTKNLKIEISNVCFASIPRKNRFLLHQIFRRKILEIFPKKESNEKLKWDSEKKLFLRSFNLEKSSHFLAIGSNSFLYPEIFFFSKKLSSSLHFIYNILVCAEINLPYKKCFEFSDIMVHTYLEKRGFIVLRFNLYKMELVKPDFICFPEQIKNDSILNIFKLNNYHSFSFPLSLTILAFRLKPGNLKIAVKGSTSLLFFSLNFGFSSFCPIFIKKKKKFRKNNKFRNLIFFSFF